MNLSNNERSLEELIHDIKGIVSSSKNRIQQEVNNQLISTYWQIRKIISQKEKSSNQSSRQLILKLSKELTKELGKGFSRSNLFNMKTFYQKYSNVQTLSGHLSWSHICELLTIEDDKERSFYEKEIANSKWSVRELKRQINTSLFQRLLLSSGEINKEKVYDLSKEGQQIEKPGDLIKEPYVLEFLGIPENKVLLEKDLEKN